MDPIKALGYTIVGQDEARKKYSVFPEDLKEGSKIICDEAEEVNKMCEEGADRDEIIKQAAILISITNRFLMIHSGD